MEFSHTLYGQDLTGYEAGNPKWYGDNTDHRVNLFVWKRIAEVQLVHCYISSA